MLPNVALLVISCDRYSDLWPIYFNCLFKFWPDCQLKVYLGSNFKEYPDERVTTILIGEDKDYSSNLKLMLQRVEEELVITTVEDLFISAPVVVSHLSDFVADFIERDAKYLKLMNTFPLGYDKDSNVRIAALPEGIRYRLGMGISLWRKAALLENLEPGLSAWAMEREPGFGRNFGHNQVFAINYHFKGELPLQFVHGVIKGRWVRRAVPWLRRHGYELEASERAVMTITSSLYLYFFGVLMAIFKKFNYQWRP